ncbi:hypothetical protein WT14_26875 [Burkholderia stagnalis]|nr:hypothetical protein WT07_02930 [Burkholderia stagnalis]KVN56486.1 hypothetical protein WT14_26875 [Burkholderia stagnalis]KWD93094.1 hypothetical protein WT47_32485 [Burkholderia stagnalis]KWE22237.1 hypothetical protein WT48_06505 [Burkholderia stagnalis]KWO86609.1 hypothetical protein WU00_27015 [Burkholderia stagnalis]
MRMRQASSTVFAGFPQFGVTLVSFTWAPSVLSTITIHPVKLAWPGLFGTLACITIPGLYSERWLVMAVSQGQLEES